MSPTRGGGGGGAMNSGKEGLNIYHFVIQC